MTTLSPLQPELLSLVISNSRAVINCQELRGDANILGISRHVQCKISGGSVIAPTPPQNDSGSCARQTVFVLA